MGALGFVRWYPAHLPPGDPDQGFPVEVEGLPACCQHIANPEVGYFECGSCGSSWSGLRAGIETFAEALIKNPLSTEEQVRHWLGDRGVELWRSYHYDRRVVKRVAE